MSNSNPELEILKKFLKEKSLEYEEIEHILKIKSFPEDILKVNNRNHFMVIKINDVMGKYLGDVNVQENNYFLIENFAIDNSKKQYYVIPKQLKETEYFTKPQLKKELDYVVFAEDTIVRVFTNACKIISYLISVKNHLIYECVVNGTNFYCDAKDVKLHFDDKKGFKGEFIPVNDLKDVNLISRIGLKSSVYYFNDKNEKVYGDIQWMGYDGEFTFKFGINLENKQSGGQDGNFFGKSLFECENGHGKLLEYYKVFADDRYPDEPPNPNAKKSSIIDSFQSVPYNYKYGRNFGIQGNRNSCYLDTTFMVMFAFSDHFDFLFENNGEKDNEEDEIKKFKEILSNQIVYPLRKHHYVDYEKVDKLRMLLKEKFPTKNFYTHEKDPEELLESMFNWITPKNYLFKTINSNKDEQNCFVLQLFYTDSKKSISIEDMLHKTLIENDFILKFPPKAFILQLPRNSTEYKMFEEVIIPDTLVIDDLVECKSICKCEHKKILCKTCSFQNQKMIYTCECPEKKKEDHQGHILLELNDKEPYVGSVKLELTGILCIDKCHYTAFVKTNEIVKYKEKYTKKWIHFNSMEYLESNLFIPEIRKTDLHKYFLNPKDAEDNDDNALELDICRITSNAFVCFYENKSLSPYYSDFNCNEVKI